MVLARIAQSILTSEDCLILLMPPLLLLSYNPELTARLVPTAVTMVLARSPS